MHVLLCLLLGLVSFVAGQLVSNSIQPSFPQNVRWIQTGSTNIRTPINARIDWTTYPEMARFLQQHPHDQHGNHFSWTMRNRGPPVYDYNGYDQYGIYNMDHDQRRRKEGWHMELVDGRWQPAATWECRGRLVDIVGTWKRFSCDCGIFGTSYQFNGCVPQNVPNPTITHN